MATNKPRLDPTLMGEAKILVEIELNKPFPQKIATEDKKGTLSMVDVEYSWLPSKCGRCDQLGHKESRCLQKPLYMDPRKAKVSPLPEPQVSETSTLDALKEVPLTTSKIIIEDALHDTLLPNTTTEVVPLLAEETTSIVEVVPHIIAPTEVHETTTTLAEATYSTETSTSSGIILATLTIENPTIITHSPPQFLSIPVVKSSDCAVNLREEVTRVDYDNDNSELASLESFDRDIHLMTPPTQRILREMPLKPNLKFRESEWISAHAFRGKRSRGRRGRRFD